MAVVVVPLVPLGEHQIPRVGAVFARLGDAVKVVREVENQLRESHTVGWKLQGCNLRIKNMASWERIKAAWLWTTPCLMRIEWLGSVVCSGKCCRCRGIGKARASSTGV